MVLQKRQIGVIPAHNCADSISNVLGQLRRCGFDQCIVVANGCTDGTAEQARTAGEKLKLTLSILEFKNALGHDVPRAVGALHALRTGISWDVVTFVDGDWKGSFGPSLSHFLMEAECYDVTWPKADLRQEYMWGATGKEGEVAARPSYLEIWNRVLKDDMPVLQDVSPSRLPLSVARHVFQKVSPKLLAHPGKWLAQCILAYVEAGNHTCKNTGNAALREEQHDEGLMLGCVRCDIRWFGNPVGSALHQRKLIETLIGDALEGTAILQNKQPSRRWRGKVWTGYQKNRNLKALEDFASSLTIKLT